MVRKSFEFLDKYKYVYFVLSSLFSALIFSFILLLFESHIDVGLLLNKTFFSWGFFYPLYFFLYEKAKKVHCNDIK